MGKPITVTGLDSVEVELFDKEFVTVAVTRSVRKQSNALNARVEALTEREEAGEDIDDELVALLAEGLDLRLKPKGNARTRAGTLIQQRWERDELTLPQVFSIVEQVGAAEDPS